MNKLARHFALLGGTVLSLLIIQTCLSVIGRSVNSILHNDFFQTTMPGFANTLLATGVGPINGDFELTEAGMAFVIFAFIPLCQLNGGHASVDIFTSKLPSAVNRALMMVIEVIFALVLIVIAWQLLQGMLSKLNSGQTTLLLQYPVWWGYAFCLMGAAVTAIIAIYVAAICVLEFSTGTEILPAELGADH
ncbi:TRAP transporter small permease [Planktotalea sp.]|uniref:TRAP transporter small permease n=1 Tax=Planktotalea sp. TaxID=2029877 RepID=UPI003450A0D2